MINLNSFTLPRTELNRFVVQGAALNKTTLWKNLIGVLPINNRTAHLPKMSVAGAELGRIIANERVAGQDAPRYTAQLDDLTLKTAFRVLEFQIQNEAELDYAKCMSLTSFFLNQVGKNALNLTAEVLTADTLFNTTNFGAAANAGTAYTRSNVATSATFSFIDDIFAALNVVRSRGEEPNAIVIPSVVWELVSRNDRVQKFLVGLLAPGSTATTSALEAALSREGYDVKVLIARSQKNIGSKGVANIQYVWDPQYIWVGVSGVDNATIINEDGVPSLPGAATMVYREDFGLFVGDTYIDYKQDSIIVRGRMSGLPQVLNPNAGTLIATGFNPSI